VSTASPTANTPGDLLRAAIEGLTLNQTLYAAASLGVADLLRDGPRTASDLARQLEVDAEALCRVLRFLASQRIFEETTSGTFANNSSSHFLRTGVPGSIRPTLIFRGSPYFFLPYSEMLYSIRTGRPARSRIFGMDGFDYLQQHPEDARRFDEAMTNLSAMSSPTIAQAYDFGSWGSLMDVGGGNGMLLTAILKAHPKLQGVLAERSHVLERARQSGHWPGELMKRCRFEPCEFFCGVPSGCRAYLMKHVIHDWDDGQARNILGNCRKAVPADGALLLVELCLENDNTHSMGPVTDIAMLVGTGGKERTAEEYRELLASSGFRLNRVISTALELTIIEAFPV
jgi:hypothetical protein